MNLMLFKPLETKFYKHNTLYSYTLDVFLKIVINICITKACIYEKKIQIYIFLFCVIHL